MSEINSLPQEELVEDLDETTEVIPYNYAITAYGADYPVDSLVKRLINEDIVVPSFDRPIDEDSDIVGFQREYVWSRPKADRFIESLLLGLPVPGIFLVKEPTGRFLILDGHQRLETLRAYYTGIISGQEYKLQGVQERFEDISYKELDVEDRRRLDDSIIHATIIRQDEPTTDQSSVYMIFERLNTGGVSLQPQEIRVALYHGTFTVVLSKLNQNVAWRELYGKPSKRLKDMELILRFFALYYYHDNYRAPMKDFLNRYMASNRNLERQSEDVLRHIFEPTVELLNNTLGRKAFRPKRAINAAVVDSLMTGLARRLERGPIEDKRAFVNAYEDLISSSKYTDTIETGTSQEANVAERIKLATESFANIS